MAYERIHNKGTLWRHEELVCDTTDIEPGMLVELTSGGLVQPHSTEGGRAELMIALEDALQGNGVDTDYEEDDIVTIAIAQAGEEFNMMIAGGETITVGEKLISAGNGRLVSIDDSASGTTVYQAIAIALETFSQTAAGLIHVRLLPA